MSSQMRFEDHMNYSQAVDVAIRELQNNFEEWLVTAQNTDQNRNPREQREIALKRARECQQAIKILRNGNREEGKPESHVIPN